MGWGDVCYCFAMAILVTSPRLLSGDVLLFYVSFSLLLLSSQTKFGNLLFLHRFLLLLLLLFLFLFFFSLWACPTKFSETNDPIFTKLHSEGRYPSQEVHTGLGIFKMATVAMETVSVCQKLWPHLYRKPPKGFPQNLAYVLRRVGRIFWQKK